MVDSHAIMLRGIVAGVVLLWRWQLAFAAESETEEDHHDHSEDLLLTTGEIVGIVLGVLFAALCLSVVGLLLLRHFDPRAWKRLHGCVRSLSKCDLDGPEHPDQPVKARDPEDPFDDEIPQTKSGDTN